MSDTKQAADALIKSNDNGARFLGALLKSIGIDAECVCHRCIGERKIVNPSTNWPLNRCVMILCPTCGNKRCPHASDHRLECTNSNEPGQEGSIY